MGNGDYNENARLYDKLGQLEHSLYRYNEFVRAGMEKEAAAEGEKFINLSQNSDGSIVLKGGISNTRYVWRTEAGACKVCQELDGKIFDSLEDFPERPHPNCKCDIEPLPDDKKDNEPCDCWEQIDIMCGEADSLDEDLCSDISAMEEMCSEAESWIVSVQEIKQLIHNFQSELTYNGYVTGMAVGVTNDVQLENTVYSILEYIPSAKDVYEIFLTNKHEMERIRDGRDKYYHAKANCESAELGLCQAIFAIIFSFGKEVKDFYQKVFNKHQDAKVIFEDCMEDLKADFYGLLKAKEAGCCSDNVKDVYDIFE